MLLLAANRLFLNNCIAYIQSSIHSHKCSDISLIFFIAQFSERILSKEIRRLLEEIRIFRAFQGFCGSYNGKGDEGEGGGRVGGGGWGEGRTARGRGEGDGRKGTEREEGGRGTGDVGWRWRWVRYWDGVRWEGRGWGSK